MKISIIERVCGIFFGKVVNLMAKTALAVLACIDPDQTIGLEPCDVLNKFVQR
jgi:hypothetical protein